MVGARASIGRVMVRNPTTNPTSKNRLFMRKTRLMVGLVRFLIRGEKKTAARIHARTGSGAGYECRGTCRRAGAPGREAMRRWWWPRIRGPGKGHHAGAAGAAESYKADLIAICAKTETVAEEGRKHSEDVRMQATANPDACKLSAAGWAPKER